MISNCKLYRINKRISIFPVASVKNYGRKMLPSSFNYVVLAVGQDPGRTETHFNFSVVAVK